MGEDFMASRATVLEFIYLLHDDDEDNVNNKAWLVGNVVHPDECPCQWKESKLQYIGFFISKLMARSWDPRILPHDAWQRNRTKFQTLKRQRLPAVGFYVGLGPLRILRPCGAAPDCCCENDRDLLYPAGAKLLLDKSKIGHEWMQQPVRMLVPRSSTWPKESSRTLSYCNLPSWLLDEICWKADVSQCEYVVICTLPFRLLPIYWCWMAAPTEGTFSELDPSNVLQPLLHFLATTGIWCGWWNYWLTQWARSIRGRVKP